MLSKKTFTELELETLTPEEIIDKIQHDGYSLLNTLGAKNLRREMAPVGAVCNIAINCCYAGAKDDKQSIEAARRRLVGLLSKLAPGEYVDPPEDSANGLVIGFNHPSLGEIARILTMKIMAMGDKPMYFPVNLPWYEALAPNFTRIKQLGVIITPTITPATWNKIALDKRTRLYKTASRLKKAFRDIYMELSHDGLKNGGVVFVAPSATRQATVFRSKAAYDGEEDIIPTMSKLATRLYADPSMQCSFQPLAILPPENYKRGLNLWKKYQLIFGEPMTAEYIRKKYFRQGDHEHLEGFDRDFHLRIAEKLPKKYWY